MSRAIHRGLPALAIALSALLAASGASAAAPMVKTQAPGYYRMMLGDFEITALSDGTSPMAAIMIDEPEGETRSAMSKAFRDIPTETSTNAYLINTGSKLILVDTGAGSLLVPSLGHLVENLKASGYRPEQVDEIYLTHLHPDHIGGLMAGDSLVFPNATVFADKHDPDLWLSQALMDAAPKDGMAGQRRWRMAMASLNPYVARGKFRTFDGSTNLEPGLKAIAAPGHTPGHTMYAIESKGQKLLLWGDIIGAEPVQFTEPNVATKFDNDGKVASEQRNKALQDASRQGYWVAGAHISFPGIGHVRTDAGTYTFVPADYNALR